MPWKLEFLEAAQIPTPFVAATHNLFLIVGYPGQSPLQRLSRGQKWKKSEMFKAAGDAALLGWKEIAVMRSCWKGTQEGA